MLSSYLPEIGSVHSQHSLTLVRSQNLIEMLVMMIQSCFFCNFAQIRFTKLEDCVFFRSESIRGWFIVAAVVLVSFQHSKVMGVSESMRGWLRVAAVVLVPLLLLPMPILLNSTEDGQLF